MIKEKLGDLGTGVIEVSWHLIIQSMRLGHRLSTQGFLAVYTKLDFDALKERIKLLIFSAWTGIKTIFHGDDRGITTGTSSLRSLWAAELSGIPNTKSRQPQPHCPLPKHPSSGLGLVRAPWQRKTRERCWRRQRGETRTSWVKRTSSSSGREPSFPSLLCAHLCQWPNPPRTLYYL